MGNLGGRLLNNLPTHNIKLHTDGYRFVYDDAVGKPANYIFIGLYEDQQYLCLGLKPYANEPIMLFNYDSDLVAFMNLELDDLDLLRNKIKSKNMKPREMDGVDNE